MTLSSLLQLTGQSSFVFTFVDPDFTPHTSHRILCKYSCEEGIRVSIIFVPPAWRHVVLELPKKEQSHFRTRPAVLITIPKVLDSVRTRGYDLRI